MNPRYKTVPVREDTYERLRAYKMGGATFDQVLNDLMNAVPLEEVSAATLRKHRQRLRTFRGRTVAEVRKALGDD
ncbi:MAG TPA: hypothetical protein VGB42_05715 [Candidatus Thermoplasmatota archaeon]